MAKMRWYTAAISPPKVLPVRVRPFHSCPVPCSPRRTAAKCVCVHAAVASAVSLRHAHSQPRPLHTRRILHKRKRTCSARPQSAVSLRFPERHRLSHRVPLPAFQGFPLSLLFACVTGRVDPCPARTSSGGHAPSCPWHAPFRLASVTRIFPPDHLPPSRSPSRRSRSAMHFPCLLALCSPSFPATPPRCCLLFCPPGNRSLCPSRSCLFDRLSSVQTITHSGPFSVFPSPSRPFVCVVLRLRTLLASCALTCRVIVAKALSDPPVYSSSACSLSSPVALLLLHKLAAGPTGLVLACAFPCASP
ncbi:hypothetical protein, conserved in T. vivax [Trypanosoma vivax Y486]|uniref:Uncharacterized protein n=1 Tax=Trypanosoma vivax (strain Y486) TaxID=1055687 RepID=F9WQX2_TRYVY|nr:hypothetical protein, conserved in T. vivax [Trypanosoma vivax Y486]|eukprot:CCD19954.1 hypothetical protein, conserved in T. vivax [Trypanosoma vivax Y486]